MIFGCALLSAQPLGVPVSLLLCALGLFVIPARVLIPADLRVNAGTFDRRALGDAKAESADLRGPL